MRDARYMNGDSVLEVRCCELAIEAASPLGTAASCQRERFWLWREIRALFMERQGRREWKCGDANPRFGLPTERHRRRSFDLHKHPRMRVRGLDQCTCRRIFATENFIGNLIEDVLTLSHIHKEYQ